MSKKTIVATIVFFLCLNSFSYANEKDTLKNNKLDGFKETKITEEEKEIKKQKTIVEKENLVTTKVKNSKSSISSDEEKIKDSIEASDANIDVIAVKKSKDSEIIKEEKEVKVKEQGIPDFVFEIDNKNKTTSEKAIHIKETQSSIGKYNTKHSNEKNEVVIIDDFKSKGSVGFSLSNFDDSKIKILINKDNKYSIYNIIPNGIANFFPLQDGSGEYNISILESKGGKGYKYIEQSTVLTEIESQNNVFLNPMQYNNWLENDKFTKLIDEITLQAETDSEILQSIYNYMIENFNYDYEKANLVDTNYLPNIDLLLTTSKGICYDYSAILSAALRYKGVPAKLIKGNTTFLEEYHSWNEVLINDEWVTIDTTIDTYYNEYNFIYSMEKNSENYIVENVY